MPRAAHFPSPFQSLRAVSRIRLARERSSGLLPGSLAITGPTSADRQRRASDQVMPLDNHLLMRWAHIASA